MNKSCKGTEELELANIHVPKEFIKRNGLKRQERVLAPVLFYQREVNNAIYYM